MRRAVSGILSVLLLMSALALALNVQPIKATPQTITVPDDYPTIQEAINNAVEGDTIFVKNGTYHENLIVTKRVSLVGEDREQTVIDGNGTGNVISIPSSGTEGTNAVQVANFTLANGIEGVWLSYSHFTIIENNNIVNMNRHGVCSNIESDYVEISCNLFNACGIWLHCGCNYNNITSNIIDRGGISIESYCAQNEIARNRISNAGRAIYLNYLRFTDNVFAENTIENCSVGVYSEADWGVYGNVFYHNSFVNNTQHVTMLQPCGNITWDDGYPSGGNFWNDYSGVDIYNGQFQNETGSDGIVDNPYIIDGSNRDNFPLREPYVPFENQTIVISSDGSIDPSGTPIQRRGNIYTLARDIYSSVKIQRSCAVVDGDGHWLKGNGTGRGFDLYWQSGDALHNVTIREVVISDFGDGIYVGEAGSYYMTGNNTIINNTIANCSSCGIRLGNSHNNLICMNAIYNCIEGLWVSQSQQNAVSFNTIGRCECCIEVTESEHNILTNNEIRDSCTGIGVGCHSSNNSILQNFVEASCYGVSFYGSLQNVVAGNSFVMGPAVHTRDSTGDRFYHNNFLQHGVQVEMEEPSADIWDNGCEGNYWSDYNGTDLNGDGIGDTELPWEGVDSCPLTNPYWIPADVNHDLIVDIFDVTTITGCYESTPLSPEWNPHADIAEPYGLIDILDVVKCTGHYEEKYP